MIVAVAGIALSLAVYAKRRLPAVEPKVLENAWFYDASVAKVVGGPGAAAFRGVAAFDAGIVDGAVNGAGALARGLGGIVRRAQTGFVRAYAALIAFGAIALLAWFVWRGWLA